MTLPQRLLVLLIASVAFAPLAPAHHAPGTVDPNLTCAPEQTYHVYTQGTGQVSPNDGNYLDDCGASASSVQYAGSCGLYPWTDTITGQGWCDGAPGDFDYETETGIGGGFFPGGPWATDADCDYGYFPHHGVVPEIDDVAYPGGPVPVFKWGADDTTLTGTGSGKVPATDPADQTLFGGDGLQCLTSGSITPATDSDDWLVTCTGEAPTVCTTGTNTYPAAGGDGGYWAFTITTTAGTITS